jgi:hypothetical protein
LWMLVWKNHGRKLEDLHTGVPSPLADNADPRKKMGAYVFRTLSRPLLATMNDIFPFVDVVEAVRVISSSQHRTLTRVAYFFCPVRLATSGCGSLTYGREADKASSAAERSL